MHIRAERSEQEVAATAFVPEPSVLYSPVTACKNRDAEAGCQDLKSKCDSTAVLNIPASFFAFKLAIISIGQNSIECVE